MASNNGFFSPYSLDAPYWIILNGSDAVMLAEFGGKQLYHNAELYGVLVQSPWVAVWNQLAEQHLADMLAGGMQVAILSSDSVPSMQEIELSFRPVGDIDSIAKSLWLYDYLDESRLVCFVQHVIDREGRNVGYEAFARMDARDGSVIGGGAIMQASHALHMEYQVDRAMHRQAIENFVAFGLDGMLFINFLTGFIHRPEVYLDGLNQAVDRHHLLPKSVVLDVPLPDYAQDMGKLESIAEYCRARGFLLSLDDVTTPQGLAGILQTIRPAVVKLDAQLGTLVFDAQKQKLVAEIISVAHASGALVLAEGVEDEPLHLAYRDMGVDMFQGYLFGAPERCGLAPATARKEA